MPHTTGPPEGGDPLAHELRAALGDGHVLVDPGLRAAYERDWTGRFGGPARLVARPGSTEEVAAVVRACARHGAAVVPQGGNTGLVGGGVPRGGEVLLSLARLDALGPVEAATAEVRAGAGVTLAALQAHARAAGLDAGLDFGARDGATLGGIVAADAGGARALRHGTARARVAGVEAVLPDGTVLPHRAGLLKDNAGYDLAALLVGSEGTLGVITGVRWRLVPLLPARVAVLAGLPSVERAAELLGVLRTRVASLEAADFFTAGGAALVAERLGAAVPFAAPVYVVVECADRHDPTEDLAAALEAAGVTDAVVADDTASRERLWRLREGHAEAIAAEAGAGGGVAHKLDVGVPLARLAELLARVPEAVGAVVPGARTILFGHLGDGNVHVNVLGAEADDERVDDAVLELVAQLGGTISAEHGVGVAKARALGLVRGPGELAAMAAVKRALDPDGLMNPGAVLAAAGEPRPRTIAACRP